MATLLNPFLRADDANGNPVSGGQLAVFEAGTTTPVTTYSDRALTTAQARPLVANSAGEFAQSFVATGIYKIRVSDADGVTLYENDNVRIADRPDDPVFFDTIALLLASNDTYAAGTLLVTVKEGARYTALSSGATDFSDTNAGGQKLMRGYVDYDTVDNLLDSVEPSRGTGAIWVGGGFRYEEVTTGEHVETVGGVKLKVLPKSGVYYFSAFGPTLDGATNCLAQLNTAIAAMNASNDPQTLVMSGNIAIDGSASNFSKNAKYIDATTAKITHDGGTLFTWGSGTLSSVVDGGILGLNYQGATTPTSGTCIVSQEGMNRLLLKNIRGASVNQFLKSGLNGFAGGYFIWDVRLTTYNGTAKVIEHGNGANSRIQGLDMTASDVSRVLDQSTPIGATATAIHFGQGGWDTAEWSGILINGYAYGLDVNRTAANKNVSNFRVTNFYFDFCSNGMRLLNAASGGGINNMTFSNGWVVGMDGYGVHLDGSVGSHRSISFDNVVALLSGKCNWRLTSQTMDGVTINNCAGLYACRLTTNTGTDQDDFVALFGGWSCRNSQFGKSADGIVASSVPNWQGRYGFAGPTSAADWVFEGNAIEGRTGSTLIAIGSNTITAGKLFSSSVLGNRVPGGAARVSYATTAAVTAPTSAALQTNNTPFHYSLFIYDGTVSSIQKNGTQIATSGPVSVDISPGDTWAVLYSSAPTIRRVIKQ